MSATTSSYFSRPAWQPLAAVGGHSRFIANAQICISILSASIVPDRPRLIVQLWKSNLTHELVLASGSMSITLLTQHQLPYLERLGLRSGHAGPKLDGLPIEYTAAGDPIFPGGYGWADCRVIDTLDLGDATAFVCAVVHEGLFAGGAPITWEDAKRDVDRAFLQRYEDQFRRDGEDARTSMRWASLAPGVVPPPAL